jgi:hypothetical protein
MKKLTVTLQVELEVPDHWQLVSHPSGIDVVQVGDQYIDFDIAPLTTDSLDPDAEWSDNDQVMVGEVLDAIVGMDSNIELDTVQ